MFLRLRAFLLALGLIGSALNAAPGTYLTVEEALALAFEDCEIERTSHYLTKEETVRVAELGACSDVKRVAFSYVATKAGKHIGTAWFDTHKVRTLRETLMIVVTPEARVRRLEMLSFAEPEDYIPREKWYAQFIGKRLEDDLRIKHAIKSVTGATLTANATAESVRRVLATERILANRDEPSDS